MAKLNIYHLFATAREEEGVSGSNLYLRIEQLAVLIKA